MNGDPSDTQHAPTGFAAELIGLVPPPRSKPDVGGSVTKEFSVALPRGYRAIAAAYGPGVFADAIRLCTPQAPEPSFEILDHTQQMTEVNRMRLDDAVTRSRWTHAFWPEPGGLLAWGEYSDYATLWWETTGDPESWPTVIEDWENLQTITVSAPAEEVIFRLLTGDLDIPFLLPVEEHGPLGFVPCGEAAD